MLDTSVYSKKLVGGALTSAENGHIFISIDTILVYIGDKRVERIIK